MICTWFLYRIRALSIGLVIIAMLTTISTTPTVGTQVAPTLPATPPPPEGTSVTFEAVADAHVVQQDPTTNFGTESDLVVDVNPISHMFIRFEVPDLVQPIDRATVRLWVDNATEDVPEVWNSPNTTWDESEVTWNTRPAIDSMVESYDPSDMQTGSWFDYDVSSTIAGSGTYTFAMIPTSIDGLEVNSREAPDNQPHLLIEMGIGERLLAAGDIAGCDFDGDEKTAEILDAQPGTVATLGDNVYDSGTAKEFAECYDPTWGRHKNRTMPSAGNHDYITTDAEAYFAYFGDVAGNPDEGYYSYNLGTWHIIVLNSNIDMRAGSEQEQWLRQDLEANPVGCTLAYWHHARFSSEERQGSTPETAALYTALYEHGADVVLTAHAHNYERFAPQDPLGEVDLNHGIRQFVVGTGGAPKRGFGEPLPNSEVRDSTHGVLQLTLNPGSYTWQFLPVDGEVFSDGGSGACHGAPDKTESGDASTVTTVAEIHLTTFANRHRNSHAGSFLIMSDDWLVGPAKR